jgi:hypothetical protein
MLSTIEPTQPSDGEGYPFRRLVSTTNPVELELSEVKSCPVCAGKEIDRESAKIHSAGKGRSYNRAILRFPSLDVIEKAVWEIFKGGQLSDLWKNREWFKPFHVERIVESDGCYSSMIEIMEVVLKEYALTEEQIRSLTKDLYCFVEQDSRVGIGRLKLSPKYVTEILSDHPKKDAIFEKLRVSLREFRYISCGNIDGSFAEIEKEVGKILDGYPFDLFRIASHISGSVVKGITKGVGKFPSEEIFVAISGNFLTRSDTESIAIQFDEGRLTFCGCKDDKERLSRLSYWIKGALAPAAVKPLVLSNVARTVYAVSTIDLPKGTISFPSKKVLTTILSKSFYYIPWSREEFSALSALANKTFTYLTGEENPTLFRHVKVYAEAALKPFEINREIVEKITQVMVRIAI